MKTRRKKNHVFSPIASKGVYGENYSELFWMDRSIIEEINGNKKEEHMIDEIMNL